MRHFPVLCITGLVFGCLTAEASLLPLAHLDPAAVAVFQEYTAKFEQQVSAAFAGPGKLWIDDEHGTKRKEFDAGKPVVEPRQNGDIKNGSIHHYSGAIRVAGVKIEDMRRVMLDYSNYPIYFKPDVAKATGTPQPDSAPNDEHIKANIFLTESTLWIDVAYDALYDSHYRRLDANRWTGKSTTISIKELRDAKKPEGGYYPEGEDHGFLWRSNTYWFARERDGGLDLQVDSMTLSRVPPLGSGWWGNKRTHDAVDKMLRDTKSAVEAAR